MSLSSPGLSYGSTAVGINSPWDVYNGVFNLAGEPAKIGDEVGEWHARNGDVLTLIPGSRVVLEENPIRPGRLCLHFYEGGFGLVLPGPENPLIGPNGRDIAISFIGAVDVDTQDIGVPVILTAQGSLPLHPTNARGLLIRSNWSDVGTDGRVFFGGANQAFITGSTEYELGGPGHWHSLVMYQSESSDMMQLFTPQPQTNDSTNVTHVIFPNNGTIIQVGVRFWNPADNSFTNGSPMRVEHVGLWSMSTEQEAQDLANTLAEQARPRTVVIMGDSRANSPFFTSQLQAANTFGYHIQNKGVNGDAVADTRAILETQITDGLRYDIANVLVGVNNFAPGVDVDGAIQDLIDMIERALATKTWGMVFLSNDSISTAGNISDESRDAMAEYSRRLERYFRNHPQVRVWETNRFLAIEGLDNRLTLNPIYNQVSVALGIPDGTHWNERAYEIVAGNSLMPMMQEQQRDVTGNEATLRNNLALVPTENVIADSIGAVSVDLSNVPQYGDNQLVEGRQFTLTKGA